MTTTEDFTRLLAPGMTVRSADGHRLGVLLQSHRPGEFIVEKGLLFTRDYRASFDDIQDVRDGEIILKSGLEPLQRIERGEVPRDQGADSTVFGGRATARPDVADRR